MPISISIEGEDLHAIARAYRDLGERAEDMRPVAFRVRDRWIESEKRLFGRRPWSPKKASTLRRYRYPIKHFAAGGTIAVHGAQDAAPLHLSGLLERTLTHAHEPGQLDDTRAPGALRKRQSAGGLVLRFGVRARGPVAYGGFQTDRHGNREARNPFSFDAAAHLEATGDVLEYIFGRHASR